jgi:DNA-binding XRE family transcriptional regulator
MRVFISWSGEHSGEVAKALQQWLPKVLQAVRPWLSSASIDPGARWSDEVAGALEELNFGILCLTPENLTSAWLLFEAGALSKTVSESRVVPYLLGLAPRDLQGPLAQFQAVPADEAGTLRLLNSLNLAAADKSVAEETLKETFELWWPKLSKRISDISRSPAAMSVSQPTRPVEDMIGEILELLRSQRAAPHDQLSGATVLAEAVTWPVVFRSLRESRTLSQAELARRSNLSPSYISRLESGELHPSAATLSRLARGLGISMQTLLLGVE